VIVAVMLANDSPYEIANVVLRKMGLYALYLTSSNTLSSFRIFFTLYDLPLLSNEPPDEMGMYLAYHVFVNYGGR
jgi:hypothetical protein